MAATLYLSATIPGLVDNLFTLKIFILCSELLNLPEYQNKAQFYNTISKKHLIHFVLFTKFSSQVISLNTYHQNLTLVTGGI